MTFQSLDSDCVGDGAANTEPADTWLQNRIAENAKAIAVGHDAFSISYANSNTDLHTNLGDRPWASLYFISVMLADLPDWNRLSGVRLSILLNCQSPEVGAEFLGGSLRFKFGNKIVDKTLTSTYSAGTNFYIYDVTLNLSEPLNSDGSGAIPLEIWFKSNQGGTTPGGVGFQVVTYNGSGIRYVGNLFTDPGTPGPTASSFETRYVDDNRGAFDVIGKGVIDGEDSVFTWPTSEEERQVQWRYLSYLQIRSIRIKPIFPSDSVGKMPSAAYLPNRIFGSVEAQREANAVKRLAKRPRILSVGPRGKYKNEDVAWSPRKYPTRTEFVAGSFVGNKNLISDVAFLRSENPKIRITIRYTSLHLNQSTAGEEGNGLWDINFSANHGDGTSIGASSESIVAKMYPAYLTSPHPLLRTWQFAAKNSADDPDFAHKEGSLYKEDLPLIQTAVLEMDLSGHDTIARLAEPVEIRLDVGLNNVVKYCSSESETTSNVRFLLIGYTITEVPV